jgi:hypothetical protein
MKSIVLVSLVGLTVLIGCGGSDFVDSAIATPTPEVDSAVPGAGGSGNDSGTTNVPDAVAFEGSAGSTTGGAGGTSGAGGASGSITGGAPGAGGTTAGAGGSAAGAGGSAAGAGGSVAGAGGTSVVDSGVCTTAEVLVSNGTLSDCIKCVEQTSCDMFTLCYNTPNCGNWVQNFNKWYNQEQSVERACYIVGSSTTDLTGLLNARIIKSRCTSCLHSALDSGIEILPRCK